ncbi:MAG: hypothetical protein ACOVLK_07945, partial [Terrimicrobiaceae bacterium]
MSYEDFKNDVFMNNSENVRVQGMPQMRLRPSLDCPEQLGPKAFSCEENLFRPLPVPRPGFSLPIVGGASPASASVSQALRNPAPCTVAPPGVDRQLSTKEIQSMCL